MFNGISSRQFAVLADVMHQLDHSPPSASANRRRAKRFDVRASFVAILVDVEGHPQVRIHTRNMSTSGLGFVSRRPFTKGERIAIAIKWPEGERKILVAKVTFARYVRQGMYEMGAEFTQALRESEVSTALRRLLSAQE